MLDGFTITGGTGDTGLSGNPSGGGIFINGSSPTITNCIFSENAVDRDGGGMYNNGRSNPTVTNCTFIRNVAEFGGGMFNLFNANPIVTSSIFWMNSDAGGTDESGQIHNMEYFLSQVRLLLPVLGFNLMQRLATAEHPAGDQGRSVESPLFEMKPIGLHARMRLVHGEFVVLEGSTARKK